MTEDENGDVRKAIPAGVGLIFGAAIGVVLSALTENAVWIGLGAGLGIIFGSAFSNRG